jgi:acyl-CoA synthetase (AMP-forming)/AMP-acid ligase II
MTPAAGPSDDAVNIASFLPTIAAQRPDAPAIFCPSGRAPGGRVRYVQCTYRQLNDDSDRIARGLEKIGVGRGVRTVLMVRPSLEFFALVFAIFKAGAVPVLVDPGIGLSNLRICLAEARPEAFIGIPFAQVARVFLGWGRRTIRTIVTVGHKLFWSGVTLDRVRAAGNSPAPYELREPRADDVAAIVFTSGNTGVSKGVVYTYGNLAAQLDTLRSVYNIEPGEVDLATFPPFALFGPALGVTTIVPYMDPTRPAAVDPTKIIQALDGFGVTNMFGSPALLNAVARYAAPRGLKFPSLRRVISAGAPVPPAVLAQFSTMLNPDTQIFTPYGATEALPVCSIGSHEILRDARAKTEQGAGICVGRPVAPTQVRVIRISDAPIELWDESLRLPDGEVGEITVSGPIVTRSYFNRPRATALAKIYDRHDGRLWHRMGDVGYFDAQGRLWFCGRKTHRVETPRGTLFTEPCEAVFNTHPAVFRSALVGIRQNGYATPILCVQLEEHARHNDQGKIRRELLALGASQPHTQAIQTVLFHPRFPVDIRHNAKILREALAVWAQKQLS